MEDGAKVKEFLRLSHLYLRSFCIANRRWDAFCVAMLRCFFSKWVLEFRCMKFSRVLKVLYALCNVIKIAFLSWYLPKKCEEKMILGWHVFFRLENRRWDAFFLQRGSRGLSSNAWNSQEFLKVLYALCNVIKVALLLLSCYLPKNTLKIGDFRGSQVPMQELLNKLLFLYAVCPM